MMGVHGSRLGLHRAGDFKYLVVILADWNGESHEKKKLLRLDNGGKG